ncbi:hypothetical protein [Paenibacillus antarcticus]|uniref:Uncharacterized protein n=1 Tax=Paenibacillus antarcticus TaxID=253703 RepID=A0A168PXR7_9BACL|nr:hypothetical protein [Paenibacillus antarcticus]OAB47171.1 hypothetical protein PBAT_07790 [Paenibacillus antarcticus]
MFQENLNSVNEDVSKRHFEEKQQELIEKPRKNYFGNLTSTLIAAVTIVVLFFLFLWLMNVIR